LQISFACVTGILVYWLPEIGFEGWNAMTEWFLRTFVKQYQNSADPAARQQVGKLAGITGIVCNVILFLGKLTVGLLSGSVSVVADAVNNLTDASSSVVTLLGFRMAQQPADEDHPYGHARYEYLSGLAVAALILLIGAELAKSSVHKILQPEAVEVSAATLTVLLCSIGLKLWMSLFFRSLGKRIGSTALTATAADSRNDVVASAAVLLSCVCAWLWDVNIDGFVGLAVALFILYSGCTVAKETISPLLGQQADRKLVERIEKLVLSYEGVLGVHDLLIHDYGPGRCFASVHVEISAEEEPMESHHIIDHIERDALTELNVHLVIHYDPVATDDQEQEQLCQEVTRIIGEIDPGISMHDFRLTRGAKRKKLIFDLAVPYTTELSPDTIRKMIDSRLREKGHTFTTVIHFDGKQ